MRERAAPYRAPPDPPRPEPLPLLRLWLALGIAGALFVPFVISAVLFLRLPPGPAPLATLGWPASLEEFSLEHALIEPSGRTVWIIARAERSIIACRVDLATARALACHEAARIPAGTHAGIFATMGGGRLLVVINGVLPASSFAIIAASGPPVTGQIPSGAGDAVRDRRTLTNTAWSASAARFEVYSSRPEWVSGRAPPGSAMGFSSRSYAVVDRLVLSPDGVHGDWEPISPAHSLLPSDLQFAEAIAGVPGRSSGAVLASGVHAWLVRGTSVTSLELPGCEFSAQSCVALASVTSVSEFTAQHHAWLDDLGALTAIPNEPDAGLGQRRLLARTMSHEGGASPLIGTSIQPSGQFTLRLGAHRVAFETTYRGSEGLLTAASEGVRHRLARDPGGIEWHWIPWSGGLLGLQSRRARAIATDARFQRTDATAHTNTITAIVSRRFRLDSASTVGYLLLLLCYPTLLALGLRAARRSRTRAVPLSDGLLLALVAFAVIAALLLSVNSAYIFPPA